MSNVTGTVTEWEDEATTTTRFPTYEPSSTARPQDGIPGTAVVIVCIAVAVVTATAAICAVIVKRRKSSCASSASHIHNNLQSGRPSSPGAALPEEAVTAAAGQIHGDHTTKAEGVNADLERPHSSSDITLSIHTTSSIHVPRRHLTDRYIFRESGREFSLISNRLFDFKRTLCIDSCWDGRYERQSGQCLSGLSSEVQDDVIVPDICSRYGGLFPRAGFAHSDHYTYLTALYRASEALSSANRESVIYDIARYPERSSYAAVQPNHNTYLQVLPCPMRPGSGDQSESDIIKDLKGNADGTEGQFTHIYNVRRYSVLHARPQFPSGEYAIPFEASGTRHSFETDFLDAPSHMHPHETSSLARYSSETKYYDMPSHMRPDETSSLARYASETKYYDTLSHMHPDETSLLPLYSSGTNYYDTPSHMHPDETSLLPLYSSETKYYDTPSHMHPDETSLLPLYSSETNFYDMPTHS